LVENESVEKTASFSVNQNGKQKSKLVFSCEITIK